MALILMENCVMEKLCLMEVYIYYTFFKQSTKDKLGQALVSFLSGASI
jgi:hypothetical protein